MQKDSAGNEFQAYTIAHIATRLLGELKKQQEDLHAIHEERKARLQTGSGSLYVEARGSQEAD